MPLVQDLSSSSKPVVAGPRTLGLPLQALAHYLCPPLPLGVRHPVGYEQLEDSRAPPGGDCAAPAPAGDDANGWWHWVCGTVQGRCAPMLRRRVAADITFPRRSRKPCLLSALSGTPH